jgi:hypothetical protein
MNARNFNFQFQQKPTMVLLPASVIPWALGQREEATLSHVLPQVANALAGLVWWEEDVTGVQPDIMDSVRWDAQHATVTRLDQAVYSVMNQLDSVLAKPTFRVANVIHVHQITMDFPNASPASAVGILLLVILVLVDVLTVYITRQDLIVIDAPMATMVMLKWVHQKTVQNASALVDQVETSLLILVDWIIQTNSSVLIVYPDTLVASVRNAMMVTMVTLWSLVENALSAIAMVTSTLLQMVNVMQ